MYAADTNTVTALAPEQLIEYVIPKVEVIDPKEQIVRAIGIPELVEVARCESGLRQFEANGAVIQGKVDHDDTGLFQINKRYHLAEANKMGIDVKTTEGNIAFAKVLYKTSGLNPWSASKDCWSKKI